MKKQIFMYLFFFALLLVLFQYVNSKRIFEELNNKIEKANFDGEQYQDSLNVLRERVMNYSHFHIENNEDALSYFENRGHSTNDLIPHIKDELYKLNEYDDEHPLIPYSSSEGRKMLINTVKILNHKWIIADFSDGEYWGEIFLTYQVLDNNEVTFNLAEAFLYPLD